MTKPREKTREELTAEIEDGKKMIRQFENRDSRIFQERLRSGGPLGRKSRSVSKNENFPGG